MCLKEKNLFVTEIVSIIFQSSSEEDGGVIDAVVEGIGDVLTNPPNVNLSPILSAVASVLRGPIRNAIANRRKEVVSRKSDQVKRFWLF